jgi:hypothetical protein
LNREERENRSFLRRLVISSIVGILCIVRMLRILGMI